MSINLALNGVNNITINQVSQKNDFCLHELALVLLSTESCFSETLQDLTLMISDALPRLGQ